MKGLCKNMRRNKYQRKFNYYKMFLIIIFILLSLFVYNNLKELFSFLSANSKNNILESNINANQSKYDIIKQDINTNYSGIGQKKVSNQDGYFTTFTDSSGKVYKEFKQNGTSSWSDKKYWDGKMKDTGCGITAMSIILSGYNFNVTPEDLRKEYYPVLNGDEISKKLSKIYKINNTDFYYDSVSLSEKKLTEHLQKDKPILICVWNKPSDNRWTTASHYMVLLAADNFGKVYISNPNGLDNTSKSSGWYDFDEVTPYIAKALYIN